ncbi:phage holin family protein [Aestuariivirga sp.]|uniref:phage holin family protein n=1 Tax=Aestuariivirga sp. TaxID=2650926 RepID=UPI003BAD6356
MLNQADAPHDSGRPGISELFERLGADGRDWAEAELALARAELGELKSQAMRAAVFASIAFAATFCAMVALTQAGIAVLTPLLGSEALAALIVGIVLVLLVIASAFSLMRCFSWRTESIFFRWFGGPSSHGGGA